MRRLGLGVSLFGALCLAWPAAPARAFEGMVKWRVVRVDRAALAKVAGEPLVAEKAFAVAYETLMSMHGDAVVTDVTVYAKGSKVRADSGRAEKGYTITDLETGVSHIIQPGEKKVTVIDEADLQAIQRRAASTRAFFEERQKGAAIGDPRDAMARVLKGAPPEPSPKLQVVSLDKQQTIDGMPARGFEVRGGNDSVVGWVTAEHPEVLDLLREIDRARARQSPGAAGRAKTALLQEGLPVRVQTLDKRAYVVEDLVQVEQREVADDLFAVPAGYTKSGALEQANQAGQLKKKR